MNNLFKQTKYKITVSKKIIGCKLFVYNKKCSIAINSKKYFQVKYRL